MSAPVAATLSGSIAFTVAAVPTGMKAGVRISPRGVEMTPVRALPEVAFRVKEKRSVMAALSRVSAAGQGRGGRGTSPGPKRSTRRLGSRKRARLESARRAQSQARSGSSSASSGMVQ
jgi:hypothetical protein